MYTHPLTATGAVIIVIAIGSFLYPSLIASTDRDLMYVQGYFCAPVGAFLFLLGVIVQGFRRLERLLVWKDMDTVNATGEASQVFDSDAVKAAVLKKKAH